METPQESGGGYAEEQPEDVDPETGGGSERRGGAKDGEGEGKSPGSESGDGKATGNPASAG
jgi:hypothetical protein